MDSLAVYRCHLRLCALIVVLYAAIVFGSLSKAWGVDYTPTLEWWRHMVTRGIEAIMDTTFLSVVATPIAALTGMVIAFLVVRKHFSGKDVLDFGSNLGGAVPGTILGIGFVLAFSTSPMIVVILLYATLALFLARSAFSSDRERIIVLALGTAVGVGLSFLDGLLGEIGLYYVLGGIYLALGGYTLLVRKRRRDGWLLMGRAVYRSF